MTDRRQPGAYQIIGAVGVRPLLPASNADLGARRLALLRWASRCLAKDPAERPQTAHVVSARLQALAEEVPWPTAAARRWWSLHDPAVERGQAAVERAKSGPVAAPAGEVTLRSAWTSSGAPDLLDQTVARST